MVKVFIPPLMRELTSGQDQVEATGSSVRRIIDDLDQRYPGLKARLCAGDTLRPGLAVAVNGHVSSLGLLQKVPDESELHFLPAVGGG